MKDLSLNLAAVAGYLPECLASSDSVAAIQGVCHLVPSSAVTTFGFECRLGEKRPDADFGIGVSARFGGRNVLACDESWKAIPPRLLELPAWVHLRAFFREWNRRRCPLNKHMDMVWLEFDLASQPPKPLVPSVWFGPNMDGSEAKITLAKRQTTSDSHRWITETAIPLLLGSPTDQRIADTLFRCICAVPEPGRLYQVGVMLSREQHGLKICLLDTPPRELPEFLKQIGWAGNVEKLRAAISRLLDKANIKIVQVNVAESVGPKIGLECSFRWFAEPDSTLHLRPFLDDLVSAGHCLPEKRDAILAWLGYAPYMHELKAVGVIGSSFSEAAATTDLVRTLNHIKVSYQDGRLTDAKAYLFVWSPKELMFLDSGDLADQTD